MAHPDRNILNGVAFGEHQISKALSTFTCHRLLGAHHIFFGGGGGTD